MLLEGIYLPLTTPFHADGRLFVSKLRYNVERYSRTPAAGLVVLGELGEADALTDEETRTVLMAAIEAAAAEKVMVASVGRESVFATLQLAEFAAQAGYDAVAVRCTRFSANDALRQETKTYFQTVADRVALPIVLASEPGHELSLPLIAHLAEHPNVIGIMENCATRVAEIGTLAAGVAREATVTSVFAAATRRMLKASLVSPSPSLGGVAVLAAQPQVKTRVKKVGFQVLCASTTGMLESWQAGATGAVPQVGACAPQACCEVWQAYKDGDPALAEEKQDRLLEIAGLLEGRAGIGAAKCGADFNGYFGGRPRLPSLPLTAAASSAVEAKLRGMRN